MDYEVLTRRLIARPRTTV